MQFKTVFGSISVFHGVTVMALIGIFAGSATAKPNDNDRDFDDLRIRRGFELAPVELNLHGKDLRSDRIGKLSHQCRGRLNDCHTADTATEFAPGGSPQF
jgi:hypothetical protein